MEIRLCAQRGRRLLAFGPRRRDLRRDRRGATPPLCRDDPGKGRSAFDGTAAFPFTHGQNAQGDRHVYASRTRFIPDRLLDLFEKTTWPLPTVGTAARSASSGPRINVGAHMRGMWR